MVEKKTQETVERLAFRDPAGFFWMEGPRALRAVFPAHARIFLDFLSQARVQGWMKDGKFVATRLLEGEERQNLLRASSHPALEGFEGLLLEHERIDFPSYPYEWSPAMLHAAASLSLDLAEAALDFGYSLKDATPYNVLFRGPRPIFVDALSFEKRQPRDGTWKAYGQFVRSFLLPLLANKHFGMSLSQVFLPQRDGLEARSLYEKLGFFRKWRPPFLSLLTLPTLLEKPAQPSSAFQPKLFSSEEQARFVLKSLFKHLRRLLKKLEPPLASSDWVNYADCQHCSEDYAQAKEAWAREFCEEARPRRLLDVGCNLGHYSAIFAQSGAKVVSVDLDSAAIDHLWRRCRDQGLDILPLVQNLAWPSPGLGWQNAETNSFLGRSEGHFDSVLMYAVVHHLLLSAQIPLPRIVELISRLAQPWLLIEYVDPQDSMFQQLLRGRESIYASFNQAYFEACFLQEFEIVKKRDLGFIPRSLYWMKRRS